MYQDRAHFNGSAAGFTLVETALGLLVAAVGLLTIASLFPFALGQAKKMSDETYAAFLSDAIFSTYRTVAESPDYKWGEMPDYVGIPPTTFSGGNDVFWKDSINLEFRADNNVHTLVFEAGSGKGKWSSAVDSLFPSSWKQYDHALRYRLSIADIGDPPSRLRSLTLRIWPGEYGPTTDELALMYYTEIFNRGH